MPTFTFHREPAMGDLYPCFCTHPEDGAPDQVVRLDDRTWQDMGQPNTIVVSIEVPIEETT